MTVAFHAVATEFDTYDFAQSTLKIQPYFRSAKYAPIGGTCEFCNEAALWSISASRSPLVPSMRSRACNEHIGNAIAEWRDSVNASINNTL